MSDMTGIDWQDAFLNAPHIPGGQSFPAHWNERAEEFRQNANAKLDVPYGTSEREKFDLFLPDDVPRGLVIFVHGGFWHSFDKSSWSDLAEGPVRQGWAVAMPSYTLAPEARISEITCQIGHAVEHAAAAVKGPIRLAGHSAGGHLVTRMVCEDSPLPSPVQERIGRVVSISGVHDLRPLQLHSMNEHLRLTPEEARTESPALQAPVVGSDVIAWVGARERPEFLRQSALLVEAWAGKDTTVDLIADRGRHHFDVVDGLKDPDHSLTNCLLA